ncbi:MAG: valine--tRNA ligase [Thermodesulfobacteriota bacterium]
MKTRELKKAYNPKEVEEKWLAFWLDKELFKAETSETDKPGFSMVIPPPNITGTLHLGHALNNTLQDIIARYKRMCGFNVLWVPGIDHAGIATQNVVERQLHAEGVDRHEYGRERFIERVWQWKEESGSTIINQLKRLGASLDWSRERFTMDEGLSLAVREVFVRLFNDGLIYRGDYIINWCPRCHTALSDLESEAEETEGKLYYLEYPVKGDEGAGLTVATTRPETMLGDTAVAVNPDDERFASLIGKTVVLPIVDREIEVIGDNEVDMEFGTGAVKITPAHDFNDFEMAKRHDLQSITIMDIDAKMNENAGRLEGMDRFEAREKVVEEFEKLGLLKKITPHKMMLGSCYRCHTVVEPILSKQWFVDTAPLATEAIKAVEDGRTRFVPKNWENTYFDWMRNIRDWCISRQIWWGHRIPAWFCAECDHITVGVVDPAECGGCKSKKITQETDVLDTWFSSALWPFSTLGWPDKTDELKLFYPTSVLSTSFDIIFFWVARMMMMGLKFMDDVPFTDVYIHALIRDAEGKKMSKSKGNVIDPLVVMDEYGTDAFRFTLAVLAAQGRDIKLAEERIEGYRNFTNKLWNLTRFALMNLDGVETKDVESVSNNLSMADRWILSRLDLCTAETRKGIDTYRFDESGKSLYRFVWHELCDWYVELSKRDLWGDNGPARKVASASVLLHVLKETIKLLHPFMPFITEEIWSYLPGYAGDSVMKEAYPDLSREGVDGDRRMEVVIGVIGAIRNLRSEMDVKPSVVIKEASIFTAEKVSKDAIKDGEQYIKDLAKVDVILVSSPEEERPKNSVTTMTDVEGHLAMEVFISTEGLIDLVAEREKLNKELKSVVADFDLISGKLANKNFVDRAPKEVVEKDRARLTELIEKRAKIEDALKRVQAQ